MPAFDLIVDGKVYHIEIPDPGETPLQVIVDGQSFEVGIAEGDYFAAPEGGATSPRPALEPVPLPTPPRVPMARPAEPVGEEYHGEISAPMPGVILSIPVSVGDQVEPGTVLCILEAMKMRNPIRATHSGVVREISVTPGQTVAYGDLLVQLG